MCTDLETKGWLCQGRCRGNDKTKVLFGQCLPLQPPINKCTVTVWPHLPKANSDHRILPQGVLSTNAKNYAVYANIVVINFQNRSCTFFHIYFQCLYSMHTLQPWRIKSDFSVHLPWNTQHLHIYLCVFHHLLFKIIAYLYIWRDPHAYVPLIYDSEMNSHVNCTHSCA